MASRSAIEWTEVTWNPTTGCDRISPGCDNCYALTLARRLKAMGQPKYQNDGDPRTSGPGFGITVHASALGLPYTWPGRRVVFVNSMSDPSGGVMILKFGSSQVNGHKCGLWHVRQMSRTGGAAR
jgi:protein gp37